MFQFSLNLPSGWNTYLDSRENVRSWRRELPLDSLEDLWNMRLEI